MKTGIELIAAERQRQVEQEGWTAEHDDEHTDGALIAAAAHLIEAHCDDFEGRTADVWVQSSNWPETPWIRELYEKHGGTRALEIAGALIAAEIDRLQRAAPNPASGDAPQE